MKTLIAPKALLVVFLLAITGCAAQNMPLDYELKEGMNTGLLILSVTHSTDALTLRYRMKNSSNNGAIMTNTIHHNMDFDNPKGMLAVIELPPGEYELYEWETFFPGIRYTSPLFSAPVTVKQGEAVYAGNFNVRAELLLLQGFTRVEYEHTITDKSARDIALFTKKYTKISEDKVKISISNIKSPALFR